MSNNFFTASTITDTIAGYVTSYNAVEDTFGLRLTDDSEIQVYLTKNTFASIISNLTEPARDTTAQLREMLIPDHFLFAYGIFYVESETLRYFEVKQITFAGFLSTEYVFEQPDWWIRQAQSIAEFYLRGQFPDGVFDWRNYRTMLTQNGAHLAGYLYEDFRQETDTISRLIYGFATAYLLTGEDRFLEAAETGTKYLRDHMRVSNEAEQIVYWYHAIDVAGDRERKIYASSFGDDYNAIPIYEQIYALVGPTQTYRITGDTQILSDIEQTINLFQRFYRDETFGGYFSHIDPVALDPRSNALGHNRARKNWNSIGDHAPAYLINLTLATGRKDLEDFLTETADLIVQHFVTRDDGPFVQERFHEDWTPDKHWGWQQNNAVVGHNLKIVWNLLRIHHLKPSEAYTTQVQMIAANMACIAMDTQRGGWYDMLERTLRPGKTFHRFVGHDRKAWWQQEQAILAHLILYGALRQPEHLQRARESSAFYNTFFLDHDDGGIYFSVLANGIPYLMGTERFKGSHSMSGYHSIELCYLSTVYTNLLITEEPLVLHFKPKPGGFPDNLLRVSPDILPPDSVRLTDVWIDDEPYADFDALALTVRLPQSTTDLKVRVRIAPRYPKFECLTELIDDHAQVTFKGKLESEQIAKLHLAFKSVIAAQPSQVVFMMSELETLSRNALNSLVLIQSQVNSNNDIIVFGANQQIGKMFLEFSSPFRLVDETAHPAVSPIIKGESLS